MFNFSSRRLFAQCTFLFFFRLFFLATIHMEHLNDHYIFTRIFSLLFQVNGDLLQPICRRCVVGESYDFDSFFPYFTIYNFRIIFMFREQFCSNYNIIIQFLHSTDKFWNRYSIELILTFTFATFTVTYIIDRQ